MMVKLSRASSDAESKPTWSSASARPRCRPLLFVWYSFGGSGTWVAVAAAAAESATGSSSGLGMVEDSVRKRFAGGFSSWEGDPRFIGDSGAILTDAYRPPGISDDTKTGCSGHGIVQDGKMLSQWTTLSRTEMEAAGKRRVSREVQMQLPKAGRMARA